MARRKMMGVRARQRLQRLRRDPLYRFGEHLNRYLKTIGWNAVVIGSPKIRGFETPKGVGTFTFEITFSGGRIKTAKPKD